MIVPVCLHVYVLMLISHLSNRGRDIAMHGSSNKCDIILQLYLAHKVMLRFFRFLLRFKIYTSLRTW